MRTNRGRFWDLLGILRVSKNLRHLRRSVRRMRESSPSMRSPRDAPGGADTSPTDSPLRVVVEYYHICGMLRP